MTAKKQTWHECLEAFVIPANWESLKEEDKPQEVHATPLCAPHYLQAEMPPSVSMGGVRLTFKCHRTCTVLEEKELDFPT